VGLSQGQGTGHTLPVKSLVTYQINIDEEPVRCAAREVFEEVGFDVSNLIDKKDFIEIELTGQINRLYLCRGVPLNTKFETKTRNEIRGIKWFPITSLPTHKKDVACKEKLGMSAHNFFMVTPFAMQIRAWVQKQNQKRKPVKRIPRGKRRGEAGSSDENAEDIPECHSIYSTPKKSGQSEGRKSEIRRRMQNRTSRINVPNDSSDDEVSPDNSAGNVNKINQSPSATKRILRKHMTFPQKKVECSKIDDPKHISLIPDRTYNKFRQQNLRVSFIPAAWKNFAFDRKALTNAMNKP